MVSRVGIRNLTLPERRSLSTSPWDLVRQLLALALAVAVAVPGEVVDRRRLNAALLHHPRASASHDRSRHCRDARSTAVQRWPPSSKHRRRSSRPSRDPARQQASKRIRTPSRELHRAIGCVSSTTRNGREPCPRSQVAGNPQATLNRAAPDNAALAGETFEIADHMHAEIATRRQRRRAHLWRVEWLAGLFDESVKPRLSHNSSCKRS